VIKMKG